MASRGPIRAKHHNRLWCFRHQTPNSCPGGAPSGGREGPRRASPPAWLTRGDLPVYARGMPEQTGLADLAGMIDHSLLHPTLTDAEVRIGCAVARKRGVAAACVKPCAVELAARELQGSPVAVCAVAGFPHGNGTIGLKVAEAEDAVARGAAEIDAVVNVGKVVGLDWEYVDAEVAALNQAVLARGAILKLIFENDYLQELHIGRLCDICSRHRVAFVKTSTGYGFVRLPDGHYAYRGATDAHLRLMRERCPPEVRIKAAGGLRTLDDLLRVRALGVSRVGATATEAILDEAARRGYR
jgi:deoxyribose-phosphate aldolase